ncbi:Rho termination factor N-terminal domain-containing protein, partial [Actinoallomurus acaciae]
MSESTELLTDAATTAPDTTPAEQTAPAPRRRRSGTGLSAMVLPELKALASSLGISGTGGMRKSQLIAAIQEKQAQNAGGGDQATAPKAAPKNEGEAGETAGQAKAAPAEAEHGESQQPRRERASRRDDAGSQQGQQQETKT